MKPKLAVITFPGNNCETESIRAGKRNGFDTELVLWNEKARSVPNSSRDLSKFDAYFLIGGFSFEDRGRSGAIPAREPIFDELRKEAKKGKVILGVCNGAQMIVESGLIPVGDNPVPFALAENIRRNPSGHVMGTGYYNVWVHLKKERLDTAFTCAAKDLLQVPIAHGEGRFTSIDTKALKALAGNKNVAYRYADAEGNVSTDFPITPNGAKYAVAMLVNDEGTIGAIMPHPERFYDHFDGDQIFASMKKWIEAKHSPSSVKIGEFHKSELPEIKPFVPEEKALLLEKKLIITDNESFSVSQAASDVSGEKINFEKSILFEITGKALDKKKILESGLILNENKEVLIPKPGFKEPQNPGLSQNKYAVLPLEDDTASALGEKLSALLKTEVSVKIYKCWDFGNTSESAIQKVLQNRLLANPNSAKLYKF